MQRDRNKSDGYGSTKLKIADPAEWTKNLEKPILDLSFDKGFIQIHQLARFLQQFGNR